ncbi:hypothetical protein AA101099_2251 [Neoasaia chiangmaiensis NBRC 101099]|nr:hypothetical protein AA101099_2251 [Neoasaia chiangmaiensis NBRC 101099]GEN13760.1 hypothetical protein NCH01_01910 [Neoasaia chiangmaiensis]
MVIMLVLSLDVENSGNRTPERHGAHAALSRSGADKSKREPKKNRACVAARGSATDITQGCGVTDHAAHPIAARGAMARSACVFYGKNFRQLSARRRHPAIVATPGAVAK